MRFKKSEDEIWDSKDCYECCSDCSSYCGEGCPLDVEENCYNCIFKDGYKKYTVDENSYFIDLRYK